MSTYRINLDEGQLQLLIRVLDTSAKQLQKEMSTLAIADGPERADCFIDAFSRIPRLSAYLQEQRDLGPAPRREPVGTTTQ